MIDMTTSLDKKIEEEQIGAPVKKDSEVKLPTHLGSLCKIKEEKELKKFVTQGQEYAVLEVRWGGLSLL